MLVYVGYVLQSHYGCITGRQKAVGYMIGKFWVVVRFYGAIMNKYRSFRRFIYSTLRSFEHRKSVWLNETNETKSNQKQKKKQKNPQKQINKTPIKTTNLDVEYMVLVF